ncbi:MAG: V-type ATPase subunit [Defluviitaleaceae bacterium]|nr:V-type ATPase subunit [Defluviitaleaceae bacterium]
MKCSALKAKIKGMSGKLLSYEDYLGLCECGDINAVKLKLNLDDRTSLDNDYAKIRGFINNSSIRMYFEALFLKKETFDLHYYTNLWKAKNKFLKGANKDLVTAVSGTEIDMQNIIRIYRLKTYYKTAKEDIYRYILPINYKISPEMIMQMLEAGDAASLLALIKSTCYGEYFAEKREIEESFYKALSLAYKRECKKHRNSIIPVMYYLFRKELEIKNIISIFEGVNYSLMPHEIMNKMRIV